MLLLYIVAGSLYVIQSFALLICAILIVEYQCTTLGGYDMYSIIQYTTVPSVVVRGTCDNCLFRMEILHYIELLTGVVMIHV